MKKTAFLKMIDHAAIEAAIARAESASSGELRVVVQSRPAVNAVAEAEASFSRLGMTRTRERNAVLIFVAPESQNFAVVGDEGVHQKCGQQFWDETAAAMSEHFRRHEFTAGLVSGIERAGKILARHFPTRPDDRNELPDGVIEQ